MFGFGPMSPFFHDEFIFNEENEARQKRSRRRERENDLSSYNPPRCPDCDGVLMDSGLGAYICCRCHAQFHSR